MSYPGGKAGAGTLQRIINQLPPHDVYLEPFAGGAAIYRAKTPARWSFLVDRDADVLDQIPARPNTVNICADAIGHLRRLFGRFEPPGELVDPTKPLPGSDLRWTIYADPPYHPDTLGGRSYYRYTMDHADHAELLELLCRIPCPVAVSGYRCPLYDQRLRSWRRMDYWAATRGGRRLESLWMNYRPAARPHCLRHLGRDKREREKLSRRRRSLLAKLRRMKPDHRAHLLASVASEFRADLADLVGPQFIATSAEDVDLRD